MFALVGLSMCKVPAVLVDQSQCAITIAAWNAHRALGIKCNATRRCGTNAMGQSKSPEISEYSQSFVSMCCTAVDELEQLLKGAKSNSSQPK
jgi:hypothetical protein